MLCLPAGRPAHPQQGSLVSSTPCVSLRLTCYAAPPRPPPPHTHLAPLAAVTGAEFGQADFRAISWLKPAVLLHTLQRGYLTMLAGRWLDRYPFGGVCVWPEGVLDAAGTEATGWGLGGQSLVRALPASLGHFERCLPPAPALPGAQQTSTLHTLRRMCGAA